MDNCGVRTLRATGAVGPFGQLQEIRRSMHDGCEGKLIHVRI